MHDLVEAEDTDHTAAGLDHDAARRLGLEITDDGDDFTTDQQVLGNLKRGSDQERLTRCRSIAALRRVTQLLISSLECHAA